MKFRIDTPRIAFEQIDDETIVIDFDSGAYFSAGPVGSDVLRRIGQGADLEAVVEDAKSRYAGDPGEIERGIRAFVDSLRSESILIEPAAGDDRPAAQADPLPAEKRRFEPPVLNKYTDMKDLLLLDPVHEVDTEGWPVQKPDA
jgi:hypothetical protein